VCGFYSLVAANSVNKATTTDRMSALSSTTKIFFSHVSPSDHRNMPSVITAQERQPLFVPVAASLASRLLLFRLETRLRGSSYKIDRGRNRYARIFVASSRYHLSGYFLCAYP